jgi:hypothetical protein
MELATAMLEAHGIPVKPPRSAREATWPPTAVLLPGANVESVVSAAVAAVRADEAAVQGGRYAVILPRTGYEPVPDAVASAFAAEPELAERIDILRVDDVKGLEFDGVTVLDPQAVLEGSARGINDLYVALTRPTQRLTVLHHGTLPPGLDRLLG